MPRAVSDIGSDYMGCKSGIILFKTSFMCGQFITEIFVRDRGVTGTDVSNDFLKFRVNTIENIKEYIIIGKTNIDDGKLIGNHFHFEMWQSLLCHPLYVSVLF